MCLTWSIEQLPLGLNSWCANWSEGKHFWQNTELKRSKTSTDGMSFQKKELLCNLEQHMWDVTSQTKLVVTWSHLQLLPDIGLLFSKVMKQHLLFAWSRHACKVSFLTIQQSFRMSISKRMDLDAFHTTWFHCLASMHNSNWNMVGSVMCSSFPKREQISCSKEMFCWDNVTAGLLLMMPNESFNLNSPPILGESLKLCSKLCCDSRENFEFQTWAKMCHRFFLSNKLSPKTLPRCRGEHQSFPDFKLFPNGNEQCSSCGPGQVCCTALEPAPFWNSCGSLMCVRFFPCLGHVCFCEHLFACTFVRWHFLKKWVALRVGRGDIGILIIRLKDIAILSECYHPWPSKDRHRQQHWSDWCLHNNNVSGVYY